MDPTYGERLPGLASQVAVWIIDAPPNVAAAKEIWKQNPEPIHMVTTFKPDSFEGLMDNIELHHGHHSQNPPFQDLEVIGVVLSPDLQQILTKCGFMQAVATADGFTVSRSRDNGISREKCF